MNIYNKKRYNKSKDFIELVAMDIMQTAMMRINNITPEPPFDRSKIRHRSVKLNPYEFPISRRNHSVYEKADVTRKHRNQAGLSIYEFPIQARKKNINETDIKDIPAARMTRPTEDTIDQIVEFTILDRDHILTIYNNDGDKVALGITVFWLNEELDDQELSKIVRFFNNAGYYLVDNKVSPLGEEDGVPSGEYMLMYFEPYWSVDGHLRHDEYVYHITPMYNDDDIMANGLLPKSELHKHNITVDKEESEANFPDRVYFFLKYDLEAMKEHMRSGRKLKASADGKLMAVIYTVRIPDDVQLYIDARTLDKEGNLVKDCAYTYDRIPPQCIVNRKPIDIRRSGFSLHV